MLAGGERMHDHVIAQHRARADVDDVDRRLVDHAPIVVIGMGDAMRVRRGPRRLLMRGADRRDLDAGQVPPRGQMADDSPIRSEEHTSELQSLMRTSYAVFCLKNKITYNLNN